jgi:hypothetical protein
MTTRIALLLLCLGFLLTGTASAQVVKKAQVGFRFLENPVSAEIVGRGATGVTIVSDANAAGIFWNPALIGWNTVSVDLSLHRTQGIADINVNALAAAVDLWGFGVLGVSVVMMDYGDFYGTRIAANEQGFEETGTFSPKAYALGLAFSQKITDRFSYGVHAKYAFQDLGSAWVGPVGLTLTDPTMVPSLRPYSDGAWALDVGACYDFQYKGVRFGASLQNISREIRYESEAFPMPFSVNFGVTLEPLQFFLEGDAGRALVVTAESRHPRDYDEKLKFGAEYRLFPEFIARFGYMTNYDERGVTAGVGFRQAFGDLPFRFDYAYQAFGIFGAVHHFTLGVTY